MNLSNKNLVLLAKFAVKAKKHIGLVKVIEMFTNPQYASNVLIKARLSDNQELAELTKEMSSELNVNVILIGAIEGYINTLQGRGVGNDSVWECKYFLIKLAKNLYGFHGDGASYRQAVEALLLNVEVGEREFCINLAREFYPFWVNENKLAAEINSKDASILNTPINEPTNITSLELWDSIEKEFFSDSERQKINVYVESLKQSGVMIMHIRTRQKMAKIIIKELRNYGDAAENYRKAIDKTLNLFTRQDLKEFFLIVSREFYSFWVGGEQKDNYIEQGDLAVNLP